MSDAPTTTATHRALRAVARHRAMGLHFLGHYLGIEPLPDGTAEGFRLPVREAIERVSDVDLGVFVDLAMGQAVRARLTPGTRLATSSLVLHVAPGVIERPIEVRAAVDWLEDGSHTEASGGSAAVRFEVTDADGDVVATGSGSFVTIASRSDKDVSLVDWSQPVPDVRRDELTPHEQAAIAGVEAAAARGAETFDGLLDLTWGEVHDDTLTGELLVGPQHDNRVGDLQGGLVYGIGATAARRLLEGRRRVIDGQVLYLRPVAHGPLTVTATVLRRGRRMTFVRVVLTSGGKQAAELTYTLGAEGSA